MEKSINIIKVSVCTLLLSCVTALLCVGVFIHAGSVSSNADLPDFTKLFEEFSSSVVNISTLTKAKRKSDLYDYRGGDLPEILRHFLAPYSDSPQSGSSQPKSLGSGFIISGDGYILTNNHVVEGADEIIVKLSDHSEARAELIGSDKRSDLAVLKIEAKRKLSVVRLGSYDDLKPGQWVAAIGSPFNFQYSITKGIISALNRSLPGDAYVPFIQTDVAINPGNSGGPLFNLKGEVIGINSQIFTRSGGFMGLSFAIPIDHVMWAVEQIKENGFVVRGWLGVRTQEVDRELAESFHLDRPMGALINQVVPGGPADKAKLSPGDIITKFNKRIIHTSAYLPMSVGVVAPGEKAEIEYIRNKKRLTSSVVVGELPDEDGQHNGRGLERKELSQNRLGIEVAELNTDYRYKLKLENDVSGVVIIRVQPKASRSLGLRLGDVITRVNKSTVKNLREFDAVVKALPADRSISMLVIRDGDPGYISFKIPG